MESSPPFPITNVAWVHQQLCHAFPGARITVTDTRRDDQHLSVHIITEHFSRKVFYTTASPSLRRSTRTDRI